METIVKETVIRTDLDHGHLAEVIEQADGTLRARCTVCGDSWGVRRSTYTYDIFGRRTG